MEEGLNALEYAFMVDLLLRKLLALVNKRRNSTEQAIKGDYKGCIPVAKNNTIHDRHKHVNVMYEITYGHVRKHGMKLGMKHLYRAGKSDISCFWIVLLAK